MSAVLVQVNVSNGGMPKLPVPQARVGVAGVEGDWSKNRKYHGGPDRAVCLFSEELYVQLREEGVDLANGAVGENFTTRGLNLQHLREGDRLRVGACVIQITRIRVPCASLKQWDKQLPNLIQGRSGWMARVVEEGVVQPGDAIVAMEAVR